MHERRERTLTSLENADLHNLGEKGSPGITGGWCGLRSDWQEGCLEPDALIRAAEQTSPGNSSFTVREPLLYAVCLLIHKVQPNLT